MSVKMCQFVVLVLLAVSLEASYRDIENEEVHRVVCQSATPCKWVIHSYSIFNEFDLNNRYCDCAKGYKCELFESRPNEGFSEYRCKYSTTQLN